MLTYFSSAKSYFSGIALALIAAFLTCLSTGAVAEPAAGHTRLVVFGDSLSAGFSLPEEAAFPAALQRALTSAGRKVTVINASVSGDTASSGLARVDWAFAEKADAVILELGANDMLRGINPERTEAALGAIIEKIRARKMPILLAGMVAAPGMGKEYETRFNAIFPALARKYNVPLYPFFLDGIAQRKELNLADGIHPNAKGVETIVRNILPHVLKFLPGQTAAR